MTTLSYLLATSLGCSLGVLIGSFLTSCRKDNRQAEVSRQLGILNRRLDILTAEVIRRTEELGDSFDATQANVAGTLANHHAVLQLFGGTLGDQGGRLRMAEGDLSAIRYRLGLVDYSGVGQVDVELIGGE